MFFSRNVFTRTIGAAQNTAASSAGDAVMSWGIPITYYDYDELGNLTHITDAESRTTVMTYDKLGRIESRTLPTLALYDFQEVLEESFEYDDAGNLELHTRFDDSTIAYEHDLNGRVTKRTVTHAEFGTETYHFAWTPGGLLDTAGDDPDDGGDGFTDYTYNHRGWLKTEDREDGDTLSYDYDDAGNRTEVAVQTRWDTSAPTWQTLYTYDGFDRLETVSGAFTDDQASDGQYAEYFYDAVGNLERVELGNGTAVVVYGYDTQHRLTSVTNYRDYASTQTVISSFVYTLGAAGQRTHVTETLENNERREIAYAYDDLYRLRREWARTFDASGALRFEREVTYTYDLVGNRTSMTVNESDWGISAVEASYTVTYNYDEHDRLRWEHRSGTCIGEIVRRDDDSVKYARASHPRQLPSQWATPLLVGIGGVTVVLVVLPIGLLRGGALGRRARRMCEHEINGTPTESARERRYTAGDRRLEWIGVIPAQCARHIPGGTVMRAWTGIALLLVLTGGTVVGQVFDNLDFADENQDGCPDDWDCSGAVSFMPFNDRQMVRLDEPSAGAVSRVYQDITVTPGLEPQYILFRFGLVSVAEPGGPPPGLLPPDSFSAFLYDPTTGARVCADDGGPPASSPGFAWGSEFFYRDSTGRQAHINNRVEVHGPDRHGLYVVVLETPCANEYSTTVRIEFGLAGAANGQQTFAVLHSVGTTNDCLPGYCCDAQGNVMELDDDDPCTKDECVYDENDILVDVTHEPNGGCGNGCPNADFDVIFMFDMSESAFYDQSSSSLFTAYRNAMTVVLDRYEPHAIRPRVGAERFNGHLSNGAIIDEHLTLQYQDLRSWLSQYLVDGHAGGSSTLYAGIDVAAAVLDNPSRKQYIVLITDGFVTLPENTYEDMGVECPMDPGVIGPNCQYDSNDRDWCKCEDARDLVNTAANQAKAEPKNIKIYVKLWSSKNYRDWPQGYPFVAIPMCECNNGWDSVNEVDSYGIMNWLRDHVVSGEQALNPVFAGADHELTLPDGLLELVSVIECDDANDLTIDSCIENYCESVPASP